jgi:hypothetical protein
LADRRRLPTRSSYSSGRSRRQRSGWPKDVTARISERRNRRSRGR